ncbi:MAG: YceI family protein [Chloroflexota bacterium]
MANTTTPESTSAVTTWAFDPSHTTVEFSAKHLMVTTVKGHFGPVTGTIQLDESDVTKSVIDATIDVAGLHSRDEKRDGHLRSADFFDAEKYPTATFKSTRIESKGGDDYVVYGDLTVRDVTSEIALNATFDGKATTPWGAEVVAFHATGKLNRKDFGLTWNVALEKGGMLVGDNINISIDVEATKQA